MFTKTVKHNFKGFQNIRQDTFSQDHIYAKCAIAFKKKNNLKVSILFAVAHFYVK